MHWHYAWYPWGCSPFGSETKVTTLHLWIKVFTLELLNQRISSFDYGYGNEKNKPSAILNLRTSGNAVKQTASQMWCLLQVLPFLVGDLIDMRSKHWHLLISLREICSIVFAPIVTHRLAVFLKQFIIEHHSLIEKLCDRNLKNTKLQAHV